MTKLTSLKKVDLVIYQNISEHKVQEIDPSQVNKLVGRLDAMLEVQEKQQSLIQKQQQVIADLVTTKGPPKVTPTSSNTGNNYRDIVCY